MATTSPLREYLNTPVNQRDPNLRVVLRALKTFLETMPTLRPRPFNVPDKQPHPDPDEKHGTIDLPLWEQNAGMNASSPYWEAYMTFLDTLAIAIYEAESCLRAGNPWAFQKAQDVAANHRDDTPERIQIPSPSQTPLSDCFQSLRVNVNLALDTHFPNCGHKTQFAVVMTLGSFKGGNYHVPSTGAHHVCFEATKLLFSEDKKFFVTGFEGERYELEFVVPDLSVRANEGDW